MSRRKIKLQDGSIITAGIPDGDNLWFEAPSESNVGYLMRFVPRNNAHCCFEHGVFQDNQWYIIGSEGRTDGLVFVSYQTKPSYFIGDLKRTITTVDGKHSSVTKLDKRYQVSPAYDGHEYWARQDVLEEHLRHDGKTVPRRKSYDKAPPIRSIEREPLANIESEGTTILTDGGFEWD